MPLLLELFSNLNYKFGIRKECKICKKLQYIQMVLAQGTLGPGGWAAILMSGNNKKEITGGSKETTNNIMELTAIIEGLKALKIECEVDIYSDSAYCVNAFNQNWIYGWIKKGWKTSTGEQVKNQELWQELYDLTKKHKVKFNKVKGHSTNKYNNRCDELARFEIQKLSD